MEDLFNFLEKEMEVPFQLVLLQQQKSTIDKRTIKTCHSKVHNTRHLWCVAFYKKTF
jgi:hypothetical protein